MFHDRFDWKASSKGATSGIQPFGAYPTVISYEGKGSNHLAGGQKFNDFHELDTGVLPERSARFNLIPDIR